MTKKWFVLAGVAAGLLSAQISAGTQMAPRKVKMRYQKGVCSLEMFGLQFACEKDWQATAFADDTVLVQIPESPELILTISRFDTSLNFLEEMSRPFFERKDLYAENFQTEYDTMSDQKAIKIKAFSKVNLDVRYVGYFTLKNGQMVSVLFSVYPKEKWDSVKFQIQEIKESFSLSR